MIITDKGDVTVSSGHLDNLWIDRTVNTMSVKLDTDQVLDLIHELSDKVRGGSVWLSVEAPADSPAFHPKDAE